MTRVLITVAGAVALSTALAAQPQTPATEPVRPPQRPPQVEPTPRPLPAPESDRESPPRPRGLSEGERVAQADLTLKGCLRRTEGKTYRLTRARNSDAAVTKDVTLQGATADLTEHVGDFVEVTGTFEQITPATEDPVFAVSKVRTLADTCETPRP